MRRILAIGGGGFMMEDAPSPIDEHVVRLTGKTRPHICYLATPSGDLPAHLEKFHAAYGNMGCETSHLAFFRQPDSKSILVSDFRTRLLEQDAIFVGGGNTKSALAVWREWGLDTVLREAWESNVLLAGMSAGAMCWFEAGLTESFWGAAYRPLDCLGLLPGGCAVHYSSDQKRRKTLHAAQQAGAIPSSIAIDDFAAAFYLDASLDSVLSWRDGSTAYQTHREGAAVIETALQVTQIGR
ncbi:MAG TPA: peptidase E [Paraburkholderia sp.]|uniref:Type 1 glutamine amidotransferase-like domain-containing protein n=1 Tax=Paraburkholderia sp. TaxID=1926495 RepID=UPI002B480F14|nr:peptidase E [Paraburkholderia sp.]HKR46440.1 peptidase E [Paraburkholderia sp.]